VGISFAITPGPKNDWIFSCLHCNKVAENQQLHSSFQNDSVASRWRVQQHWAVKPHNARQHTQRTIQVAAHVAVRAHAAVRYLWSHISWVICSFLVRNSSTCRAVDGQACVCGGQGSRVKNALHHMMRGKQSIHFKCLLNA
jgi:hypothetical protein